MSEDPKQIVEQAYDHVADWYLSWVSNERSPRERYTDKLLSNAPPSPHVLELGCGPGVPVTRKLLDRGARVVANDISMRQLDMARERCPEATFLPGDMAALIFAPNSFDGIICFYTIFHLPRAEQKDMLTRILSWLKPGGMFVCNFATVDEEEIHGEMLGHGMFWSSFAAEESKEMMMAVGFELVVDEVVEAGDGKLEEGDADYGVKFLWLAAKKGGV
jgi:ubiquinone/menaquinone biosynthesis C-methylase UbiE